MVNANPVSGNDAKLEDYVSSVLSKNFYSIADQKYSIFATLSRPDPGIRYSSFISTGSSLVPRPVRAVRVTSGDVTSEITEDDWERG